MRAMGDRALATHTSLLLKTLRLAELSTLYLVRGGLLLLLEALCLEGLAPDHGANRGLDLARRRVARVHGGLLRAGPEGGGGWDVLLLLMLVVLVVAAHAPAHVLLATVVLLASQVVLVAVPADVAGSAKDIGLVILFDGYTHQYPSDANTH